MIWAELTREEWAEACRRALQNGRGVKPAPIAVTEAARRPAPGKVTR